MKKMLHYWKCKQIGLQRQLLRKEIVKNFSKYFVLLTVPVTKKKKKILRKSHMRKKYADDAHIHKVSLMKSNIVYKVFVNYGITKHVYESF